MEKEDARPGLVAYEEYPGVLNEPSQGCLLRLRGTQGRGTAMTYAHSSSKINESYFAIRRKVFRFVHTSSSSWPFTGGIAVAVGIPPIRSNYSDWGYR